MHEYQKSDKKKSLDEKITQQLIDEGYRVLELTKGLEHCKTVEEKRQFFDKNPESFGLSQSERYSSKKTLNSDVLMYMQHRSDLSPLIYDLRQLIIMNNRTIVKTMHELVKTDQHDPYSPNDWIYHSDWDIKDVLNYVRNYYDIQRKEDDIIDLEFGNLFRDNSYSFK